MRYFSISPILLTIKKSEKFNLSFHSCLEGTGLPILYVEVDDEAANFFSRKKKNNTGIHQNKKILLYKLSQILFSTTCISGFFDLG